MTTPSSPPPPPPAPRQWITHKPGDPMPCEGTTRIFVKLSNGMETETPMKAKQWLWNECGITSVVGWCCAERNVSQN